MPFCKGLSSYDLGSILNDLWVDILFRKSLHAGEIKKNYSDIITLTMLVLP
jgi:hypothetical protein